LSVPDLVAANDASRLHRAELGAAIGFLAGALRKASGDYNESRPVDRFAGLLIDKLLAQPVAGLAVDLAERNPLRG
jgi:hypothetical protein